ncbi:MAG: hypothetical protein AB1Z19_06290, partial [Eubacteriales bacterium]
RITDEPVFESDIDFWQEVLTEYGEIESPMHLKLLLKKLETEAARESAKIKKKQRLVAQRNKAAIKKEAKRKKAEKRAFASLPPSRKADLRQKQADAKLAAKMEAAQAKADAKEAAQKAKADLQAKKVVDAEFNMQEKLFMLSLTPQEKADYKFLRNAKKRIEAAQNKITEAKEKQSEVASSNVLPIKGFLITLGVCIAVTALITFCATNMYIDSGYYTEKVGNLKTSLEEFKVKLDGGPVSNAKDFEGGISVYQQILDDMPVVEEQLQRINTNYFWVMKKETPETLGLSEIAEKATALQTSIDALQTIMDTNTSFSTSVDEAYQNSTSLDELVNSLSNLSIEIDQLILSFDEFNLPAGLPSHRDSYREKLVASQTYVQLVISYVNELVTIRADLDGTEASINSAKNMNTHSSDSLEEKVDDYMKKMDDIVEVHKKLTALNNNIDYAQVIGKKDFAFLAGDVISESGLTFYMDMVELEDIIKESNRVEQKCLDLPYPKVATETNETILTHRSQGSTDKALSTNQELIARIAAISVPDEIAASVRTYKRGLDTRNEFLLKQQEYIKLSEEKDAVFSVYTEAKVAYETAKYKASAERSENGRTDLYYSLRNEMDAAEKRMDEAESAAEDDADAIQELMKDVRSDAAKSREEYQDDLDF